MVLEYVWFWARDMTGLMSKPNRIRKMRRLSICLKLYSFQGVLCRTEKAFVKKFSPCIYKFTF